MTPPTPQAQAAQLVKSIEGLAHQKHSCDEGGCGYTTQAIEVISDALSAVAQAAREEAVKTIRCERPDDIIVVDHPDTLDGLMSIKSPCHPHHIVIGEVKFVESAFTAGATAQREADAKVAEEEGMKRAGEKIYASYAGGFGRDIAHAIRSAPLCQPGDGHVA